METQKYSVYNPSRESFLSAEVTVIDTTLEPLKVLKVMIEGLALNAETGLWLTPLNGIPKVPRLSPFDLVYLDGESRVVQGAELLPGVDFPTFTGEAASALVLPFRTMSSSQTRPGDLLTIQSVEELESQPEPIASAITPNPEEPTENSSSEQASEIRKIAGTELDDGFPSQLAAFHWLAGEKSEKQQNQDDASVILQAQRQAEQAEPFARNPDSVTSIAVTEDKKSRAEQPMEKREDSLNAGKHFTAKRPVTPKLGTKVKSESRDSEEDALKAVRRKLAEELEHQRERNSTPTDTQRTEFLVKQLPMGSGVAAARPVVDSKSHRAVTQESKQKAKKKGESQTSERESTVTRALRWLYPDAVPLPNRRGALRCPMPELVAYHWTDGIPRAHPIGDISSTGIYLVTERRWPRGELISFTLQRKGPPEGSSERRVKMKAEAVRWGKEGIGFRFVLPTGMDLRLWDSPPKSGEVRGSEYVMHEVRMTRALSFVSRICPLVSEGVGQLFQKEFSSYRSAGAVEIALNAEEFLAFEPDVDDLRTHPALVLRILEVGSWADLDFIRRLWAGLLVTSCTPEGNDESNLTFADTLSVLTPIHLRILTDAWAKAIRLKLETGTIPKNSLYCTAEEISKIAGTNDLTKIHRAVTQLADLGLLEKPSALSFASNAERLKTTPTPFGMQMYARCNRYRGEL